MKVLEFSLGLSPFERTTRNCIKPSSRGDIQNSSWVEGIVFARAASKSAAWKKVKQWVLLVNWMELSRLGTFCPTVLAGEASSLWSILVPCTHLRIAHACQQCVCFWTFACIKSCLLEKKKPKQATVTLVNVHMFCSILSCQEQEFILTLTIHPDDMHYTLRCADIWQQWIAQGTFAFARM